MLERELSGEAIAGGNRSRTYRSRGGKKAVLEREPSVDTVARGYRSRRLHQQDARTGYAGKRAFGGSNSRRL